MCGIAGIVRLDGRSVDMEQLDALTSALAHRGPDGFGTFRSGNVGLGHRRLKIIDLSEAAAQPMASADGNIVLTFNGEIYNFAEHRARLSACGYRFRSQSDTEVLLALYEEMGPSCVRELRGMFAFAVYDARRRTLLLARDRLGKKPIKYFRAGGVFAFASELKALRALPQCPRGRDDEAIHHFLTTMYLPSPATGFAGIRKLPAAHTLTLDLATGAERLERYWTLRYNSDPRPSVAEWEERVLATIDESVRLRMVADVPVGAFLSGGLDSSCIVARMARMSPHPVRTFSIGSDVATHNELSDAAVVARAFSTDHHPITLTPDIVHLLPELVRTYEEPYGDPSAIPTYLMCRETRKTVTVALNGDGGDENFAGYVRYPILLFSQRWQRMPRPLHALVRRGTDIFHALAGSTLSYRCRRFQHSITLPWEQRVLQYLSFFTEEEKRAIERPGFAQHFPRTDVWYCTQTAFARAQARDLLHRAMSADIATYLSDDLLPKVDLGSMAHGLEARSPLLDHCLLELTACIPPRLKLRGLTRKWILKRILRRILPRETLRKRKQGFRLPLDAWFRTDLRPWVDARLLDAPPAFWEIFDRPALERFLSHYYASRTDLSDHVWALLWLSEWFRQYP